jgi:histidine ammonia-lyase
MLNAARTLAARGDWQALAAKIGGAPKPDHTTHAQFESEVRALMQALAGTGEFHAGTNVRAALAAIRASIAFMRRDRAMDADIQRICALVASGRLSA